MDKKELIVTLDAIVWTLFGMSLAYFHMGFFRNFAIFIILTILAVVANAGVRTYIKD